MKLKQIYLLHHSHYDRGYTHTPRVIDYLQFDFIDQGIDMLEHTQGWDNASQPRWTIEVHEQLRQWLMYASPNDIQRLKQLIAARRIGLGAIQYNTTPLSSVESLCKQLVGIRRYRDELGFAVKVAFQHDVTGVPWIMSDLLLDAGIELLVMAINLHTGGNGPKRPRLFKWRTPQGRVLRVFSGHHYGTFDAVAEPLHQSLDGMKAGIEKFWQRIVADGYPYDFLYLTTTHDPVADDNGGPNVMTAEKVREWNARKEEPAIRYVTPEQFMEVLHAIPDESLPEYQGDWTDFWNYGAGSTADETARNADSKQKLFSTALLGSHLPDNTRIKQLEHDAWKRVVCYDEHTWGMDPNASRPNHINCVTTAMSKRMLARDGLEMARYVLGNRLAESAVNPVMFMPEGLLAANPASVTKQVTVNILPRWRKIFGHLNGFQYRHSEAANPIGECDDFPASGQNQVQIEVAPFTIARVPWKQCHTPSPAEGLNEYEFDTGLQCIESPTHKLEYDPASGRFLRFIDKRTGWNVLARSDAYDLLTPIHEKPDPAVDGSRQSYYKRNIEVERALESCWNPDWKAIRKGPTSFKQCRVQRDARTISVIREYALEDAPRIIQKFELSADHSHVEVGIIIHKDRVETPEAIYFATALNLESGWQAQFDASGMPVVLDDEQLPNTSLGWVTAEAFSRIQDDHNQFCLFAPQIPLVQFGNFNFGAPPTTIPRGKYPLHLLWACNNYWETNFPVTQEGVIRLRCGIDTSNYSVIPDIYRSADAFSREPLFLPLATCSQRSDQTLVSIDNSDIRLVSVSPADSDSTATIYRLVNYDDSEQTFTVTFGRPVHKVMRVTPVEEILQELDVSDSRVTCKAPSKAVVSLFVM